MNMYRSRTLAQLFFLLWMVTFTGCAQRMTAVMPDADAARTADLRSISVLNDAGQIEILANKPLTYTFYKIAMPPKAVIDLAQTLPGAVPSTLEVNKGSIKSIDVTSHNLGSGVMTRIEVLLAKEADFTVASDPADKGKLLLTFNGSEPAGAGQKDKPVQESIAATEIKEEQPAASQAAASAGKESAPAEKPAGQAALVEEKAAAKAEQEAKEPAAPGAETHKSVTVPAEKTAAAVVEPTAAVRTEAPEKAVPSAGKAITAITKESDGIVVEVRGGVDSYNSFKLTQPERLVIDLPGVKSALTARFVDIGAFGVGKARIGASAEKVRLVFDAQKTALPPYQISKTDAGLWIRFGEQRALPVEKAGKEHITSVGAGQPQDPAVERGQAVIPSPALAGTKPLPAKKAATGKAAVESIDFRQLDGATQIAIQVAGGCEAGQPVKSAKGLTVTLKNCSLPKKLQRPLDTSGFVSVIRSITPYAVKSKTGSDAKILVSLRSAMSNSIKRDGDMIVWEFKDLPRTAAAPSAFLTKKPVERVKEERALEEAVVVTEKTLPGTGRPSAKKYTGRKVSLEFSDADIRKIFQLIAEVSNLNFLISDDVTGTISIKLVNVPWDQALDVILENKGLAMQRDGNIVQIRPKAKMKSLDEEELERRRVEERKMELNTRIFDVNFATLADVEKQFKSLQSLRQKEVTNSITSDARTNKVIVTDIEPALQKMKALLESLDVPEKQVMIEARIVEASSNFTRDLGVQWGLHYRDGSASFANINASDTTFGGIVSTVLPTTTTGGLANAMSFGKLTSNIQLDLRLSAAATIGQVKIISTPKVLTVNNKAAKISQGQSIPYQTTSAEGTKTEFIEAALTLEVTPHITADGSVSMKIKASNNSPGSGTPPPINKKEATTELVVKNGETTVIGGIYVDTDTETDTGVPFLSDIPLFGWLFKSNSKNKVKTELLIFITPKLVS
jgi:type IV pilus assembly protein PilQ